MKIALTRSDTTFERYEKWLKHYNVEFEVLDYKGDEKEISKLEECSGLILSGGVDIYPDLYCEGGNVNSLETYTPERDDFELRVIDLAMNKKLPILAICRGCQLMNVYFKGSIIYDLMDVCGVNHDRISETEGRIHEVNIIKGTMLYEIIQTDSSKVNSYHHQAIDLLGDGLIVNAKSDDGIIEGIEYSDKKNKPFFLGIQWHPERFKDLNDPASENILNYFINECKKVN
ncbi:MAG TPA: gamma-glutamyl-gamma-aminobutyrate hydrolase family protein [Ignavibacteria bacterium]|nr:gamma-glutamyl-gamma-aminobutyrate hydrolase family protein [Ignavibacteria bacterium]HMR39049.1 gamma-glutamyl-gamma-aminobutyrate hydrolase family protein [Ignavibacteria bacterium]